MMTGKQYIDSLRGLKTRVYMFGEQVENWVDHPIIRPSILRFLENICLGSSAVMYRTESMHGAGSPQAQRILIARQGNMEAKKALAKAIAGITYS